MEREWMLGEDLATSDNLLDGITFDELILQVHCNCSEITPEAVQNELKETMMSRLEDLNYLLDRNMNAIMAEAMKGRSE